MRTCGALVVSALLVRIVMVACQAPVMATYNFTIARWDALACGAMIALALRSPRWYGPLARWRRPAAVTSLGVLLLQMVIDHGLSWSSLLSQTIGYSALALGFGFLILEVVDPSRPAGWLRRLCEARVLGFFGKYSYGLYVYHALISYHMMTTHFEDWLGVALGSHSLAIAGQTVLGVAASLGISVLSYELFEKRFLALKSLFEVKTMPEAAATAGAPEVAAERAALGGSGA